MKQIITALLILFSSIAHAAEEDKENRPPSPPMPHPFVRTQEDIDAVRAYLDRQFARSYPQAEWFTSVRGTQEQPPVRRRRDNPNENSER